MSKRYFGTDGIRGKVGTKPISADWILKLGWALGSVISRNKHGKVIIGKDTRISGYMFESALEAGLAASGTDIYLLGPMPTPGIAYLTKTLQADAGVVISASHNPHFDNGIKFFTRDGTKFPDELELAIEEALEQPLVTVNSKDLGRAARVTDAAGRYIEFCKSSFARQRDLAGFKIVLDCANGATYHVAPKVFKELGADVVMIGCEPDGININQNCGSTSPDILAKKVLAEKAHCGIALDGDGDRIIMVDELGNVVDGDEILFVIANWYFETRQRIGGVVGTLMSNLGLEEALAQRNIEFMRTNVGDKHIIRELEARDWVLGGESSGHILCMDAHSTGDGIISALKVLAALHDSKKTLFELTQKMKKYPQVMHNVKIAGDKNEVLADKAIKSAMKKAEKALGKNGRVLLRPSGTEPLVRVMVEAKDEAMAQKAASELKDVVEKCHAGAGHCAGPVGV